MVTIVTKTIPQRDFGNVSVAFGFFKRVLNKHFLSSTVTAFHFISYQVKNLESKNKNRFYIGVNPVFFLSLKVNHITPKIVLEE